MGWPLEAVGGAKGARGRGCGRAEHGGHVQAAEADEKLAAALGRTLVKRTRPLVHVDERKLLDNGQTRTQISGKRLRGDQEAIHR